ncbi:phage tail protein [Caulobacter mirabilis]|uniref:Phage tail protein n=1 Tax=Caulobacter mirabilis TaxID=69666 RepID=A0A2D2B1H7_9CAUL|nr:tail fiber protein [Caulobacter mirabilis]ATQ44120.1 phage tail protein [Caulobacter mirabilis]
MSTPYLGEIRMFGFPRIPTGWQNCNGQLLSIAEYDALFNLLGTTYGGDGITTFAVPDLRGRLPLHQGQGQGLSPRPIGQSGGTETVLLNTQQIPSHTHSWMATQGAANSARPANTEVLGALATDTQYLTDITGYIAYPLAPTTVQPAGGSQPHENMMPSLTVNICIALFGIYPSQG